MFLRVCLWECETLDMEQNMFFDNVENPLQYCAKIDTITSPCNTSQYDITQLEYDITHTAVWHHTYHSTTAGRVQSKDHHLPWWETCACRWKTCDGLQHGSWRNRQGVVATCDGRESDEWLESSVVNTPLSGKKRSSRRNFYHKTIVV